MSLVKLTNRCEMINLIKITINLLKCNLFILFSTLFIIEFMLTAHEDDTKSFRMISRIYDILVLHNGVHWHEFNHRWKVASSVKKALEDRV